MTAVKRLWASVQGDPVFMRRVNGWLTIFWLAMIPSFTSLSFLGLAMPVFWLALLLQILFVNIYLKWHVRIFYTSGLNSSGNATWPLDRLQHIASRVDARRDQLGLCADRARERLARVARDHAARSPQRAHPADDCRRVELRPCSAA
jgi:hypothetical protein